MINKRQSRSDYGANHGIGAATVKALAVQEAKVFISYYREVGTLTMSH